MFGKLIRKLRGPAVKVVDESSGDVVILAAALMAMVAEHGPFEFSLQEVQAMEDGGATLRFEHLKHERGTACVSRVDLVAMPRAVDVDWPEAPIQ